MCFWDGEFFHGVRRLTVRFRWGVCMISNDCLDYGCVALSFGLVLEKNDNYIFIGVLATCWS